MLNFPSQESRGKSDRVEDRILYAKPPGIPQDARKLIRFPLN